MFLAGGDYSQKAQCHCAVFRPDHFLSPLQACAVSATSLVILEQLDVTASEKALA